MREKIDAVDRDLSYAHQQLIKKEKEYNQAKSNHEKKLADKKMLTEHLNVIIFENERRYVQCKCPSRARQAVSRQISFCKLV